MTQIYAKVRKFQIIFKRVSQSSPIFALNRDLLRFTILSAKIRSFASITYIRFSRCGRCTENGLKRNAVIIRRHGELAKSVTRRPGSLNKRLGTKSLKTVCRGQQRLVLRVAPTFKILLPLPQYKTKLLWCATFSESDTRRQRDCACSPVHSSGFCRRPVTELR